jgi:hypothetical protein
MCYNDLNCIDLQESTLKARICTQTARYAPSKNTAILANLANRTLTKGDFTLKHPSGAIKKQRK